MATPPAHRATGHGGGAGGRPRQSVESSGLIDTSDKLDGNGSANLATRPCGPGIAPDATDSATPRSTLRSAASIATSRAYVSPVTTRVRRIVAGMSAYGSEPQMQQRAERWASTMDGRTGGSVDAITFAHDDSWAHLALDHPLDRPRREAREDTLLAPEATRGRGGGHRALDEEPDPHRTCFERDRDRILHSSAFRRLSGKTQVFVFPEDHQRTRLTHALEVAQVASSLATALGLNVPLAEAIAIGHDCGHGPGGHASEDALSPYLHGGYDHAVWGADVTLVPLNLCAETLDGVRNHSWSRPAPATPEGEVVSWADRIAYVCHDFEDAVAAGIVTAEQLPPVVASRCGTARSRQLGTFIRAMISATARTGRIGMEPDVAEALAAFRRFNYDNVYLRPASTEQARAVIALLRALVDFYAASPGHIADAPPVDAGTDEAVVAAVGYVSGMTDRYAFRQAVTHLRWNPADIPRGVGT